MSSQKRTKCQRWINSRSVFTILGGEAHSLFGGMLDKKLKNADELIYAIGEYADVCSSRMKSIKKHVSAIGRYLKRKGSRDDGKFSWPSAVEERDSEMRLLLSSRITELAIIENLGAQFLACVEDEVILWSLKTLKRELKKQTRERRLIVL